MTRVRVPHPEIPLLDPYAGPDPLETEFMDEEDVRALVRRQDAAAGPIIYPVPTDTLVAAPPRRPLRIGGIEAILQGQRRLHTRRGPAGRFRGMDPWATGDDLLSRGRLPDGDQPPGGPGLTPPDQRRPAIPHPSDRDILPDNLISREVGRYRQVAPGSQDAIDSGSDHLISRLRGLGPQDADFRAAYRLARREGANSYQADRTASSVYARTPDEIARRAFEAQDAANPQPPVDPEATRLQDRIQANLRRREAELAQDPVAQSEADLARDRQARLPDYGDQQRPAILEGTGPLADARRAAYNQARQQGLGSDESIQAARDATLTGDELPGGGESPAARERRLRREEMPAYLLDPDVPLQDRPAGDDLPDYRTTQPSVQSQPSNPQPPVEPSMERRERDRVRENLGDETADRMFGPERAAELAAETTAYHRAMVDRHRADGAQYPFRDADGDVEEFQRRQASTDAEDRTWMEDYRAQLGEGNEIDDARVWADRGQRNNRDHEVELLREAAEAHQDWIAGEYPDLATEGQVPQVVARDLESRQGSESRFDREWVRNYHNVRATDPDPVQAWDSSNRHIQLDGTLARIRAQNPVRITPPQPPTRITSPTPDADEIDQIVQAYREEALPNLRRTAQESYDRMGPDRFVDNRGVGTPEELADSWAAQYETNYRSLLENDPEAYRDYLRARDRGMSTPSSLLDAQSEADLRQIAQDELDFPDDQEEDLDLDEDYLDTGDDPYHEDITEVTDRVESAYSYQDQDGFSAKVSSATPYNGEIEITGEVYNQDGEVVGNFSRRINLDNRNRPHDVYHGSLFIDDANQGTGFGTRYSEHIETQYWEMGVRYVDLSASGGGDHVGGYAWAARNYTWRDPTVTIDRTVSDDLKSSLQYNQDLPPATLAQIRSILEDSENRRVEPIEIANIGRNGPHWKIMVGDREIDMWWGKEFMADRTWQARKWIHRTNPHNPDYN